MKQTINNFHRIYAIFCLLILLSAYNYVEAAEPFLLFSYQPDRTLPTPLSGAKIDADFYISVPDPQGTKLTLSWTPNPDDVTDGYKIYQGVDITTPNVITPNVQHNPATFKIFTELPAPYNTEKRVWQSYWESDITTNVQRDACFRLRAFNVIGESGYSEALCTTLSQVSDIYFYLDDPGQTKPPIRVEITPPYDLMGTAPDNSAIAFNIADISAGQHVLVAVINFTQGATPKRLEAGFEVVKKLQPPTGVQVQQELVW